MFNHALERSLDHIFSCARETHTAFITPEHLLMELLDNPEAGLALIACGANLAQLRSGLTIFTQEITQNKSQLKTNEVQTTAAFQRILQNAIEQANGLGHQEVTGLSVLLAIFSEIESQAVHFLNQEQITYAKLKNYATDGLADTPAQTGQKLDIEQASDLHFMCDMEAKEEALSQYTVNLNQRAQRGQIDPLIGREHEINRCIQVLCRRAKNNPLFVGEAGVGKTALAEGLAQRIVSGDVPPSLINSTVYSVNMGLLLSGTKYRGEFEKRFTGLLKSLDKAHHAIIFIDEIHNLVGAGSATGGTMDAANLIKPLLSAGNLRCMGATTYDEYRQYFSKDGALLRRFQKIDVIEPSIEETIEILRALQPEFEQHHGVTYSDDALKQAAILSDRYLNDRQLPDKAIDVIDEAGAAYQIRASQTGQSYIEPKDIATVLAHIARIPIEQITQTDQAALRSLNGRIKASIYGQDNAVDQLTNAIKLARSGLKAPDKPIGSFLLTGPTGVGKTALIQSLSETMGVELIRFDMSEYMEQHAIARLIGAPPGYVGHEQGGLLTEAIIKHPHAVLLLDEIEKAHPSVFNLLLQVMDYGKLTDHNGREADFRHVLIAMTSNIGADLLEKNTVGFSKQIEMPDITQAVHTHFSPEFRNRLDGVLPFNKLDSNVILKIANRELDRLSKQLKAQGWQLHISEAVTQHLAKIGYSETMGARPMARAIDQQVKQPISEILLSGTSKNKKKRTLHLTLTNELISVATTEEGLLTAC
jgi:ATP-dependent Clp protease ATP-binding subunit ClpA